MYYSEGAPYEVDDIVYYNFSGDYYLCRITRVLHNEPYDTYDCECYVQGKEHTSMRNFMFDAGYARKVDFSVWALSVMKGYYVV